MTRISSRIDSRRQDYLNAMGITTWALRDIDSDARAEPAMVPHLKLGPGAGGTLMICATDTDAATRLANDISRTLNRLPVWAWPVTGDCEWVTLTDAVNEHLFTSVAIFGAELAALFFGHDVPNRVHTAKLVQLPAMRELVSDPAARHCLWSCLCRSGLVESI